MTESKSFPQVQKLQNVWIIPCCVRQVQREDEEGTLETFYQYQEIRSKQSVKPGLEDVRKHVMAQLNEQNDAYIHAYYPQGTQQSLQALANDPDVSQATKDQIKLVWDWIKGASGVLPYYYEKKSEIRNATDIPGIMQVVWDFAQFDASKPDVTLEGLLSS